MHGLWHEEITSCRVYCCCSIRIIFKDAVLIDERSRYWRQWISVKLPIHKLDYVPMVLNYAKPQSENIDFPCHCQPISWDLSSPIVLSLWSHCPELASFCGRGEGICKSYEMCWFLESLLNSHRLPGSSSLPIIFRRLSVTQSFIPWRMQEKTGPSCAKDPLPELTWFCSFVEQSTRLAFMISVQIMILGMDTYQHDRVQTLRVWVVEFCRSTQSEENALLVSSNVRMRQDREQYGYLIKAFVCCPHHLKNCTPTLLLATYRHVQDIELSASEYLLRNRIQHVTPVHSIRFFSAVT